MKELQKVTYLSPFSGGRMEMLCVFGFFKDNFFFKLKTDVNSNAKNH